LRRIQANAEAKHNLKAKFYTSNKLPFELPFRASKQNDVRKQTLGYFSDERDCLIYRA